MFTSFFLLMQSFYSLYRRLQAKSFQKSKYNFMPNKNYFFVVFWYGFCICNYRANRFGTRFATSAILAVFARLLSFWLADCHYGKPIGSADTKRPLLIACHFGSSRAPPAILAVSLRLL
jgi:hypothetical protein